MSSKVVSMGYNPNQDLQVGKQMGAKGSGLEQRSKYTEIRILRRLDEKTLHSNETSRVTQQMADGRLMILCRSEDAVDGRVQCQ